MTAVTGTVRAQWEPLRRALREDDKALQRRLVRLRDAAGLPTEVSALRVFDVICWRGRVKTLGSDTTLSRRRVLSPWHGSWHEPGVTGGRTGPPRPGGVPGRTLADTGAHVGSRPPEAGAQVRILPGARKLSYSNYGQTAP